MKYIKISYFRCFDEFEMSFKDGINLLIGDNASGKTSLLLAVKYALSAFFSGFSDENTKLLSPKNTDFYISTTDGIQSDYLPVKITFKHVDSLLPNVMSGSANVFFDMNSDFVIQKNSPKNSRSLLKGIKVLKKYADTLQSCYVVRDITKQESQVLPLPLFACYSTEDIHSMRKLSDKIFTKYIQKRSFGYYECLEANGLYPYWHKRLLSLQEGQQNIEEIEIVKSAITKVLGGDGCGIIDVVDIRPVIGDIFYKFIDGRIVNYTSLSDGYKRLISIVTDLAIRCALLNRSIYGIDAINKTKGVVLIDEIDMHLHPTLQSKILTSLKNTFEGMQFIVTTHAPIVMSEIKNDEHNVVYKLSYENNKYEIRPVNTYGLDVSTISKVILNQSPRTVVVQEALTSLFNEIDNGNFDEAKVLIEKIRTTISTNIPELLEAETMINFATIPDESN